MFKAYETEGDGTIRGFYGKHRWLSNFWPSPMVLEGIQFPTVEHAYQCAKCVDVNQFNHILAAETAGGAKARGRRVKLKPDWDEIKLEVMEELVRAKFTQNKDLAQQLLDTAQLELIEDNHWGDTFWGVCKGQGTNHLGKILMKIRDEIRRG